MVIECLRGSGHCARPWDPVVDNHQDNNNQSLMRSLSSHFSRTADINIWINSSLSSDKFSMKKIGSEKDASAINSGGSTLLFLK